MDTYNVVVADKIANGIYSLAPRRKGRSFVWNVIAEVLKEDGTLLEGYGYCRTCRRVLKFVKNQTSNLSRHKCCRSMKNMQELKTVTADDRQLAVDTCVEWIIDDCQPFSCVSGTGFSKMIAFFIKIGAHYGENVDLEDLLPDATTISRKVQETADEKREALNTEIRNIVKSGGASATIDMWSDRYIHRNILGATLHYQKNFEAFNIVLGVKSMDFQNTTSENILIKLKKLFNQFGVENIDDIKFVTDQDENILKALENKTRLNCSSHLLAKVLDKSFEETSELKETLQGCKKLVKYFKRANLKYKLPTSIKNPCSTNWNSNYSFLKTIADNWYEINKVVLETGENNRHLHMDISLLAVLVELCKHFEVIFKKLQVRNSPSLSFVLPSIYKIKSLCIPNGSDIPAIAALKRNIVKNTDLIWVQNLSIWHMTAFFLFPPAVSKQQNDLKNIKEFCISQIKNSNNCKATSYSEPLLSNSSCTETSSSINKYDDLIDIKDPCISQTTSLYNYEATSTSQPLLKNDLYSTSNLTCAEASSSIHNTKFSNDECTSTNKSDDLIDIKDPCISQATNLHNSDAISTTQSLLSKDFPSTSNSSVDNQLSVEEYSATNKENQFFFSNWLDTTENSTTFGDTVKDEVEEYSKQTVKMTENFDLIEWWRNNEKQYPGLSKFALQIHSIPASCAAPENIFSLAGSIMTEKRCRLESKSLNNSLFLNSYFKLFSK